MLLLSLAHALPVLTDEMREQALRESHHQRLEAERQALDARVAAACPATELRRVRWGSVAPANLRPTSELAKKLCVVDPRPQLSEEAACIDRLNVELVKERFAELGWTLHSEQPRREAPTTQKPRIGSLANLGPLPDPQKHVVASVVETFDAFGPSWSLTELQPVYHVTTSRGERLLLQLYPSVTVARTVERCHAWVGQGTPAPPRYVVYTLPPSDEPIAKSGRHDLPLASLQVVDVDTQSGCCVP